MGLKGVTLTGKLSTRPDGGVKQSVCTYTHGKTTIQIDLAPHQPSLGPDRPSTSGPWPNWTLAT